MKLPDPLEYGFNPESKDFESKEQKARYIQDVRKYAEYNTKNQPPKQDTPISISQVLDNINEFYKGFRHRGKPMAKRQVKKVLQYGIDKGYTNIEQFTEEEVDLLIQK